MELNIDVNEVNLAGVGLARQAVRNRQFVFGDISSTGQHIQANSSFIVE